jgi:molybdopterin-containing oxidoreductase family membrane subunit
MLWALPTGMQYVSPMFWMGVFYSLYLGFLLLKFWRLEAGDWHSGLSRALGLASFVSVVIAHATLGLVFGMMSMRPAWYSDLMPVHFLVTAGLSGAAFAVFFTYLAYGFDREGMPSGLRELKSGSRLPNIIATLIGITILMVVSRAITGYWTNLDGMQAVREMVTSFWFQFELWACLVLPFTLMVEPRPQREQRWQILAAVLMIVGLYQDRDQRFEQGGLAAPGESGETEHSHVDPSSRKMPGQRRVRTARPEGTKRAPRGRPNHRRRRNSRPGRSAGS